MPYRLPLPRVVFALSIAALVAGCLETEAGAPSGNGTCANTCAKALALGCPNEEFDQAGCEEGCAGQQAACSGSPDTFQRYLDCIDANPMVCGDTTGTATAPACLSEGLATLACVMGGDRDSAESDRQDDVDGDVDGDADTSELAESEVEGIDEGILVRMEIDGQWREQVCVANAGDHPGRVILRRSTFDDGAPSYFSFDLECSTAASAPGAGMYLAVRASPLSALPGSFVPQDGLNMVTEANVGFQPGVGTQYAAAHNVGASFAAYVRLDIEAHDPSTNRVSGTFRAQWTQVRDGSNARMVDKPLVVEAAFNVVALPNY